ncbi:MAG: DUF4124 domain-containing protein [Desulfobacterota bacterium]|nr:DUF4124 domain-containing protein [Thermodesulfobacteriota bacterium]
MKKLLLFLLIIGITKVSYGQIYKWVDEKGVVHFTDDPTNVPEKYRSKADEVGVKEERPALRSGEASPRESKGEPYKDRLGRGEEYWRNRVEEWRKRLKSAQEKLEELRVKYNELTEKFNDAKTTIARQQIRQERDRIKQEMDHYRSLTEEAKMMLEKKIPEEAEFYKAKAEWVK